nr:pituitary tumor-transforming gene 1 protein-interacting protein-like [Nerophis lumbriciformis]
MSASYGVFLYLLVDFVAAQTTTHTNVTVNTLSTCVKSNSSCAQCLHDASCLWCESSQQCMDYPVHFIVPPSSLCPMNDARWGLCWVNLKVVLITLTSLAGLVLLALLVCCMCCCCRRRRQQQISDDGEVLRAEQKTRERIARQKERRMEMQLRHDKIRQKYGLTKDPPYSRLDDKK